MEVQAGFTGYSGLLTTVRNQICLYQFLSMIYLGL